MKTINIYLLFDYEDKRYLDLFLKHLKTIEHINLEDSCNIPPGKVISKSVYDAIVKADILIVGISQDLLVSENYQKLKPFIFDRVFVDEKYLIPILLTHCTYTDFEELGVLPGKKQFISSDKRDNNDVVADITQKIKETIEACRNEDKRTTLKSQVLGLSEDLNKQRAELAKQQKETEKLLEESTQLKNTFKERMEEVQKIINTYETTIVDLQKRLVEQERQMKELKDSIVPLHRCYHWVVEGDKVLRDDHCFLIEEREVNSLKNNSNWIYEGIEAYVFSKKFRHIINSQKKDG